MRFNIIIKLIVGILLLFLINFLISCYPNSNSHVNNQALILEATVHYYEEINLQATLKAKLSATIASGCPYGCTYHKFGCDIKGNISYEAKEKIYHLPGQEFYDVTEIDSKYGERWFCTEEEAIRNGWRSALSGYYYLNYDSDYISTLSAEDSEYWEEQFKTMQALDMETKRRETKEKKQNEDGY